MSHQSDLIAEDIQAYLKQHENKELLRLLTCGASMTRAMQFLAAKTLRLLIRRTVP